MDGSCIVRCLKQNNLVWAVLCVKDAFVGFHVIPQYVSRNQANIISPVSAIPQIAIVVPNSS